MDKTKIALSILIPTIPERIKVLSKLYDKLLLQVGERADVEILSFCDNKKRSIGYKRDALVQCANGKYCVFVDDDDDVSIDYVSEIIKRTDKDYDVIMFNTMSYLDGKPCKIRVSLDVVNEEVELVNGKYKDCNRQPFHTSVWRTEIAKSERFADVGYGEDWDWAKRLIPKVESYVKIDKFLHIYKFDSKDTKAPIESNEVWKNPNHDIKN